MKKLWHLILAGAASSAMCGCAYRSIELHEVRTVQTEEGRKAVVRAEPYLAYREVIERSPNVKSVTRMTDLKGKREPSFFAISPDGEWLVYQALEKKLGLECLNLWKISTRGGAAITQVTAGRYLDMEPAYGPEGTSIYFASNRSSRLPKLWRIRADAAGGITRITQAESEDRCPAAAPGGKLVYYASRPFNAVDWQIWRITADGSLPTELKEGRWPKLSPDGKKVLYSGYDRKVKKWKVWMMNVDGTNQTQLTSEAKSEDLYPAWSPDGRRIVFASNSAKDSNGKRNHDIWMMDADGSNMTQLTTSGSTDLMRRFSPDGKHIYFLSNRGFFWDIWRMEIVRAGT